MMKKVFDAWAINTGENGFIGRFWKFKDSDSLIPIHMAGCRVALFQTRSIARHRLLEVRRSFPKAKVSKVKVTIDEV